MTSLNSGSSARGYPSVPMLPGCCSGKSSYPFSRMQLATCAYCRAHF